MFITTRNKGVTEIVERSEFIKKRKAMAQKTMAAISKNWDYIKKSGQIKSRDFEYKEYSTHQKLINEFKNKTPSESRCFIIGGGPSLKGFDFSRLSNEFTIAINRAHEFIENPSIIFFIDEDGFYNKLMEGDFGQEALKKFQKSRSLKIALNISGRNYENDIYSVPISEKPETTFDLKEGLYDGGNSGFAALNLAVCAGIKTIYLLGYDMKGDGKGNQAWFHSGYKQKSKERNYKDWIEDFEKVAPILKNKGIKVINLNPNSELKCFEFGKFENVRRKIITVITPTGDRPLAFALCQQWMKHQTLQPDQWIVVDDGKVPMKPCVSMQYVRREPRQDDPKHTLVPNLKAAVPLIKGDKVMIIEDDEYYAPGYVAKMALGLDQHEVVGIGNSKYYHLPSGGYFKIGNTTHASLAETGFRSSFLPEFKALLNKSNASLDSRLWTETNEKGRGFIFIDSDENPLYLGIKGLSGRLGIGVGHNPTAAIYKRYSADISREKLKRWVPKDYDIYMDILKGKLTDKNYQSYFSNITGITVCYNTKSLIERAYNSIRKFHPNMPIIIIDGSDSSDPCTSYVKGLASNITMVVSLDYNIGHGQGMCMGINKVKTKYALIFDSDIEMLKSPVNQMLGMIEEDTFGVGYVIKTGFDGINYGLKVKHKLTNYVLYLHPQFQLINVENYQKFRPYINHGAPCISTMLDIYEKGLSKKILKDFPKIKAFVKHCGRGTRNERKAMEKSETRKLGTRMKTMAFITRIHPQRPEMLKICIESVKAQTSNDYVHILSRDDKTKNGYGRFLANKSFSKISPINAKYVMAIDDDDMIIDPDFVKTVREIVNKDNPEIIFFKNTLNGHTYPWPGFWKNPPVRARIGGSCFAVRLDIWKRHIHEFGRETCGDFNFISTCYKNTTNHIWLDRIVAKTQKKAGHGRGENEHA